MLPLISSDELMIRDFAEFDDGAEVAADICIVGGGAAGITLAREFIGTRFSVLMLEGGGLEAEAETQKLYDSEVVGLPHTGVHEGRARVFGGTTTLWGGQASAIRRLRSAETKLGAIQRLAHFPRGTRTLL